TSASSPSVMDACALSASISTASLALLSVAMRSVSPGGAVDGGLNAVEDQVNPGQELLALGRRTGPPGRPGDAVQVREGLLVYQLAQQLFVRQRRRGRLVRPRMRGRLGGLGEGAGGVVREPGLAERVGGEQADGAQLLRVREAGAGERIERPLDEVE